MRKWLILVILLLAGFAGYNYIYQSHRDIHEEQAAYTLSAQALSTAFLKTPSESELKYLNKTIEISGNITEINKKDLTLNESVFCQFSNLITLPSKKGTNIKIKGRVIGYDDLLEQVKVDQCFIVD
ncbi:OB-fold protein [Mariniflexile sp. AS56]|uniref:OB-fold protein n=1 Tax=Mariniflexile sp. AS56 TaxID=3063957 RepID=UPI0026F25E32|nr:hypothetical protein [Mariniflexile sp. AS56]MDO7170636.1 hypothetical protein [Mariniflexile sp. AS56]